MNEIRLFLNEIISKLNIIPAETADGGSGAILRPLLIIGIVLIFTLLIELLLRLIFVRLLTKVLVRLPLFTGLKKESRKFLSKVIRICSVSIFINLLSLPFPEEKNMFRTLLVIVCSIYIAVLVMRLFHISFDAMRSGMLSSLKYRNTPFVNLFQVFKIVVYFIGALYIVSLIFSIDMKTLFGSLAALSAVLLLVFKDTLMGFVASIQLSSNDMIRVGDWITSPKHNVDGDVVEISLATVKIRSFDNTMYTIPPYALVADPVINWRAMQDTGARRCMRSIYVDMKTIKYAENDLIERLRNSAALGEYITNVMDEIREQNAQVSENDPLSMRRLTNVGLFRRYIVEYLKHNDKVSQNHTLMVRQRDPEDRGLPLQLYFFTNTVVWVEYEGIVSDVFDHVFAVVKYFELDLFQNINSLDGVQIPNPAELRTYVENISNKGK
ncbi:MAG: mechanosensitive ion channel [Porphyromonas sp.]|nr:mechanosensitive ion channel [Porphyromonas sp.]